MKQRVILTAAGEYRCSAHEHPFALDELQEAVGGYIEIVGARVGDVPLVMVLNEEGKLAGLPVNHMATAVAHCLQMISTDDWIAGDVLFALTDEDGELQPLTEDLFGQQVS